jgi:alcohol dehydrogenase class IV
VSQVFFVPTRVFAGAECVVKDAAAFRNLGKKALVVTGKNSAKVTGAEADVKTALSSQGLGCVIFDRVPPNPGFVEVREAAALARKEGCDFIIGIGGGSPLDAAKAIAVLAANDLTDDQLLSPPFANTPLPIAAIPTTAGTGSEVTQYAILTNDKLQTKSNVSHESVFPKIAFLDARYTQALPRHVTVNTALDALSHLTEGAMANRGTALSFELALQGLSQLGPGLKFLGKNTEVPLEWREKLLLASNVAGMVIAHTGTTAVHALGYSLTYFKDIDHGRANALTLGVYLRYMGERHPDKVGRMLRALDLPDTAAFQTLLDSLLGTREHLTKDEIAKFAAIAIQARNIGNTPTPPSVADIEGWYAESLP